MRKVKSMIIFTFLSLISISCSNVDNNDMKINELWFETVTPVLEQDLWIERDKYDASTILMLPMLWAFKNQDQAKIMEFNRFFERLYFSYGESVSTARVSTSQFQFFVSEYLALKYKYGMLTAIDRYLIREIKLWAEDFWNAPAWLWGREPFVNMNERLLWKLKTDNVQPGYYKAIFDEELFLIGIVSNLSSIDDSYLSKFEGLKKILWTILEQEIIHNESSDLKEYFIFQKGVWSAHPDYLYVGNQELGKDLEKNPINDIATDSSHMHRWPLLLQSFSNMFVNDQGRLNYISELKENLSQQFNEVVYMESTEEFPAPRINNFFDGNNGVFRYRYRTQAGSGYGPYQLSGTLVSGWYGTLTYSPKFHKDLSLLLNNMPLIQDVIDTYVGPNTTRERNPYFARPSYFLNGFAELNMRITLSILTLTNPHELTSKAKSN